MPHPSDETRIRFLTQQQDNLDELARIESPLQEFLRIVCHEPLADQTAVVAPRDSISRLTPATNASSGTAP